MIDDVPLACHITFGTYGTRLHGDPRGTVDRSMNQPGDPIIGTDPSRWIRETERLRFPLVFLDDAKRRLVEAAVPNVCKRGDWEFHICAAGPDHVHSLLSSSADGKAIRKWLKRWLGEELSARWPLLEEQSWWAEGGSVKWVWKQEYFDTVYEYIRAQHFTQQQSQ